MGRSQGEVTVTTFCPHHEQPGALCPRCVTLISVALGTLEHATVREIADLADDYALRILDDLPNVTTEAELRDGLAGALLSFLAEAILTAHNQRTESSHSLRT
jgi:hypothetical protein